MREKKKKLSALIEEKKPKVAFFFPCANLRRNISNNNIVGVIRAFGEGDVIQNVCDVLDETCSFCLMTPVARLMRYASHLVTLLSALVIMCLPIFFPGSEPKQS